MTISYEKEPSFRGYMPLGVENTEGKVDGREQVEYAAEYGVGCCHSKKLRSRIEITDDDCQNLRESSPLATNRKGEEPYYYRLRVASNPWPDDIQPNLRPAIMEYVTGVLRVADRLRDAMCLALNVDPREVAPLFGEFRPFNDVIDAEDAKESQHYRQHDDVPFWSMKLVSYPAANVDALVKDAHTKSNSDTQHAISSFQGVGAHTDTNFLTLILQDPQTSGLQVQSVQDGAWIDVPPTESNILVCNIGELAEIWTGGYFLATPHRVMRRSFNQSGQKRDNCRTSIPIFYNPKLDTVMESMIKLENLPWERTRQNQWRRSHNRLLNSVGENSFKSLARSHPGVFSKHHGDLRILDDGRILKR